MGRVTEQGELQCGYHGWCFDGATGRCTRIPNLGADERPSRSLRVVAFLTGEARRPQVRSEAGGSLGLPDDPSGALTRWGTAVSEGFVFVWSGPPVADGDDSQAIGDGPRAWAPEAPQWPDATVVEREVLVRAPFQRVVEALALNPGRALGLGAVLGSGEEISAPRLMESEDGTLAVERERFIFDRIRLPTFDPLVVRAATVRIESRADNGLTCIRTEGGPRAGATQVVVAPSPLGSYRTAVRWRATVANPLTARALAAAGSVLAASRRVPAGLEALADESLDVFDPAVDVLRADQRLWRCLP